jgi:hypothetical protein
MILLRYVAILFSAALFAYGGLPLFPSEIRLAQERHALEEKVLNGLGSIALDGTLSLSYDLGGSELRLLGARYQLVHAISLDEFGQPQSEWIFDGLKCFLAMDDEGFVVLVLPARSPLRLSDNGKNQPARPNSNWNTFWPECDISTSDGITWHFSRGLLRAVRSPILGQLTVETKGGLISKVSTVADGIRPHVLLDAEYDRNMHLVRLLLGDAPPNQFSWNRDGQLSKWIHPDGTESIFTYNSRLLVELKNPNGETQHFRWAKNRGANRSDSRWNTPVHLAAMNLETYSYELTSLGFLISRNIYGRERTRIWTLYNPRTHQLQQAAENFKYEGPWPP